MPYQLACRRAPLLYSTQMNNDGDVRQETRELFGPGTSMARHVTEQHEDAFLQALEVALQQPAVVADQRNICTLLQVSKGWRTLIKQSASSLTDICLRVPTTFAHTERLSDFTAWMVTHPGLIQSLDIWFSHVFTASNAENAAALSTVRNILEYCIQLNCPQHNSVPHHAITPFRIRTFKISVAPTAAMLEALPAATLTRLQVNLDLSFHTGSWYSALSGLSRLQQLELGLDFLSAAAADNCWRALQPLKQLTHLVLEDAPNESDLRLLPTQLRKLYLQYTPGDIGAYPGTLVDLQRLTSLQHLWAAAEQLAPGSSVPSNLQTLKVDAEWPTGGLVGLASLHEVTSIQLTNSYNFTHCLGRTDLQLMRQLSQLEYLTLSLRMTQSILGVAAAWRCLPLVKLYVDVYLESPAELQQLMQHVAVATKLTDLAVRVTKSGADTEVIVAPEIVVFEPLRGLTQLSSFSWYTLDQWQPPDAWVQDVQQLTGLRSLTSLYMYGSSDLRLNDAAVCAMARALTCLQSLSISVGLSVPALRALATITLLHELSIISANSAEDARMGLQLLTSLSRLTRLQGFDYAGEEALTAFWASIQAQR